MSSKSNVDYLRDILKDNDEGLELLSAIENELTKAQGLVQDAGSDLEDKNEKIETLEATISDLEREIDELGYSDEIDWGSPKEPLKWSCGNLAIDGMMSVLGEKLDKYSPQQIENVLTSLP
jgi:hypothetical protein